MGEVVDLNVLTTLDIPCEKVVDGLHDVDFEKILVIGFDADGRLFWSSSTGRIGDLLLLMERVKFQLLDDHREGDQ